MQLRPTVVNWPSPAYTLTLGGWVGRDLVCTNGFQTGGTVVLSCPSEIRSKTLCSRCLKLQVVYQAQVRCFPTFSAVFQCSALPILALQTLRPGTLLFLHYEFVETENAVS